jgi:hypothetical protein
MIYDSNQYVKKGGRKLKSIMNCYIEKAQAANLEEDHLVSKIEEHEHKISQLYTDLKGLQNRRKKIIHPDWIDEVVEVLAQNLANKLNKKFMLIGPSGDRKEITIYLMNDGKTFQSKSYWTFTIAPGDLKIGELFYISREGKDDIGDLKPIPKTTDEIIELLVYCEPE